MELTAVFRLGLGYGLVLSILLNGMILVSLYINPEIWADAAPADVKAKMGPISETAKRQRALFMLPFFSTLVILLVAALAHLRTLQGGDLSFWPALLLLYTMLMVFNLTDLLLIDWLLVETIRPRFAQLPRLGKLANVRHYGFHLRNFFIGSAGLLAVSIVFAALSAWLF